MIKRNAFEVRDQIYRALPTEELRKELDYIINPYKAPESYWNLLTYFVNKVISYPPQEDWEWNIISILTTKSVDELKEEVK